MRSVKETAIAKGQLCMYHGLINPSYPRLGRLKLLKHRQLIFDIAKTGSDIDISLIHPISLIGVSEERD